VAKQVVWPPTRYAFIAGHDIWKRMHQPPTIFEVRRRHSLDFSINQPADRNLWIFDLKPGAYYCPSGGQPSYQFLYFWDYLWANTCQTDHVTLRSWPLTLEVMALVGDTGPRAPSVYQD